MHIYLPFSTKNLNLTKFKAMILDLIFKPQVVDNSLNVE